MNPPIPESHMLRNAFKKATKELMETFTRMATEHIFRKLADALNMVAVPLSEMNEELYKLHLDLLKYKTKKRSTVGRCFSRIKRHYHPNKGLSDELISQI